MSQAGKGAAQGEQGQDQDCSGQQVSPPLPSMVEENGNQNGPAKVHPSAPADDPEVLEMPKKGTEDTKALEMPKKGTDETKATNPPEMPRKQSDETIFEDATELCLPTHCRSLVASMLSCAFMFVSLLTLTFAEVGLPNGEGEMGFLLRFAGGAFLFYIPMVMIAKTPERNYYIWAIQPGQPLHVAYPDSEVDSWSTCRRIRRSYLMPCMCHTLSLLTLALLIRIPFGLVGTVLMFPMAGILCSPIHHTMYQLLGPPIFCKCYVCMMAPWTGLIPVAGASVLAAAYIGLRELAGPCVALAMPILVGCFEFVGTLLVSKVFVEVFVKKIPVREAYSGTNQGILVSTAICSLHASAEAVRLSLLFMDYHEKRWKILVPILIGVLWNVLLRIGFMDRCLHMLSCRRWKPNNSSKFLRESGYPMGYPRFGAIVAILLVKCCFGVPIMWHEPLVLVSFMVFLAEVLEDALSYALRRLKVKLSPMAQNANDHEVEVKAQKSLSRRPSFLGNSLSVIPVSPQGSLTIRTARWQARAVQNFKYGPRDFGELPGWAHLLPAMLSQFHTILAVAMFLTGPMCEESHPTDCTDLGLVWWRLLDPKCYNHSEVAKGCGAVQF